MLTNRENFPSFIIILQRGYAADPEESSWKWDLEAAWHGAARSDLITSNPKLKLLDQVREVLQLKNYSL